MPPVAPRPLADLQGPPGVGDPLGVRVVDQPRLLVHAAARPRARPAGSGASDPRAAMPSRGYSGWRSRGSQWISAPASAQEPARSLATLQKGRRSRSRSSPACHPAYATALDGAVRAHGDAGVDFIRGRAGKLVLRRLPGGPRLRSRGDPRGLPPRADDAGGVPHHLRLRPRVHLRDARRPRPRQPFGGRAAHPPHGPGDLPAPGLGLRVDRRAAEHAVLALVAAAHGLRRGRRPGARRVRPVAQPARRVLGRGGPPVRSTP